MIKKIHTLKPPPPQKKKNSTVCRNNSDPFEVLHRQIHEYFYNVFREKNHTSYSYTQNVIYTAVSIQDVTI